MLNKEHILETIRPYLTSEKKLQENDFNRLFSGFTYKERYQIVELLIDEAIDCIGDKGKLPIDSQKIIDVFAEIDSEDIAESKKPYPMSESTFVWDAKQLLDLKNEQLCVLYQQGDPFSWRCYFFKTKNLFIKLLWHFQSSLNRIVLL